MSLYNLEAHLWTIRSWSASKEPHGYEFSLWVSPRFLDAACNASQGVDLQDMANQALQKVGLGDRVVRSPLHFSAKCGLDYIELPGGGGCGLNVQEGAGGSAMYRSHNVDTAEQQSILFALWYLWAQHVEQYMAEEAAER